ncbi:uncharacterized protein ASCRUDRAFT_10608 [Ascoidea rubescens DSM 1968]|uniref:Uncharacterized protein n=1 Tax=Ascoidea rubescens DSM 1968 TaxID=1344418 RepID=A0A1D2V8H8_9ASCO|nr:hypothetical protein ASCRUDRAFT_10608 [Ascoidea rubescens DSM 1968]ODV58001.1 hypothetical protein ASCRUDRAFT_10608 [Ascoidea rubescens DSM 1968]
MSIHYNNNNQQLYQADLSLLGKGGYETIAKFIAEASFQLTTASGSVLPTDEIKSKADVAYLQSGIATSSQGLPKTNNRLGYTNDDYSLLKAT